MAEFRPGTPDQTAFLDELIAGGLLIETGVAGVYGRSETFEDIRLRFDDVVSRAVAPDGAESLRFPPVLPKSRIESTGYLKSFPHLAGSVFSFEGSESDAAAQHDRASRHEDWSEFQADDGPGAGSRRLLSDLSRDRRARQAARGRGDN